MESRANATIFQTLKLGAESRFELSESSHLSTSGSLLVQSNSPNSFAPRGRVVFSGNSSSSNPQFLEAPSKDLLLDAKGFTYDNFLFGTIEIAANRFVRLVDDADNAQGSGKEVVYTNALIVRSGATLDLNAAKSLRLYARSILVEAGGSIINGSVLPILEDGGPLVLGVPTPAKLMASEVLTSGLFLLAQVARLPSNSILARRNNPHLCRLSLDLPEFNYWM